MTPTASKFVYKNLFFHFIAAPYIQKIAIIGFSQTNTYTAMTATTLLETDIPSLKLLHKGKVRDIYDIDDKHMLIVTTDRLSAFDVVLPQAIPGKGEVLTRVANFWFERFKHLIPNQLSDLPLSSVISDPALIQAFGDRALVVKKLKALPIEAIVRGYLIGSGWKDYQQSGEVCGISLPQGLTIADPLPQPIYTPSSKADVGGHDENIDFDTTVELVGEQLATQVREISLQIYSEAAQFARDKGIIIADTKFEFGIDADGTLHLIDEVLTPDSSRFWPADQYQRGISPPSFDKQIIRDYLESTTWNKKAPAPHLPNEVIQHTAAQYAEAERILTSA